MNALINDGANTVCDRFAGTTSIAISGALVVAATIAWRLPPRLRMRVFAGALVISVPGYYALFAERADSPATAMTTAARLETVERLLEDDAHGRGCATEENSCEPCQPITRFAHGRRGVCRGAIATTFPDAGDRCEAMDLGCLPP